MREESRPHKDSFLTVQTMFKKQDQVLRLKYKHYKAKLNNININLSRSVTQKVHTYSG